MNETEKCKHDIETCRDCQSKMYSWEYDFLRDQSAEQIVNEFARKERELGKSEGRKEALERIKFKESYADGYWICSCGVAVSPTPENINEHIAEHLKEKLKEEMK